VQTVERVHKSENILNGRNRLEDLSPLPTQKQTNETYLVLNGKESTPDRYGESEMVYFFCKLLCHEVMNLM
jgi:hypothetical protein